MLAWFKKKFGKQQEIQQPGAAELQKEELPAEEQAQSSAAAEDASTPADASNFNAGADVGAVSPAIPPALEREGLTIEESSTASSADEAREDERQAESAVDPAAQIEPEAEPRASSDQASEYPAAAKDVLPVPVPESEITTSGQTEAFEQILHPDKVPGLGRIGVDGEHAVPEGQAEDSELADSMAADGLQAEKPVGTPAETAVTIEEIVAVAAPVAPESAAAPAVPVGEQSPSPGEPEPATGTTPYIAEHDAESDDEPAAENAVLPEETKAAELTAPEEETPPVSSYTQEKPAAKSMFRRLQDRLGKSRSSFVYQLDRLFMGEKEISQDLFDQLEELLITADLGVGTTMDLLDKARKQVKRDQLSDPQALKHILKEEILAYITASDQPAELVMPDEGPFVIMVVGVNGVGKTTTIGKIAAKFVRSGQSVLLIAGDTFRAAAIDQLKIWGERVGVEVMAQKTGSDPASVAFDGIDYGVAHGKDVILIDTAGRLHTSVNLMEELKKMQRVIGKRLPGAPHEVLQVLDATTGQNGIAQAKLFHEAVGVSGLALTKLDGTAKGGIVPNICRELKIPVRFIGIGEQLDDLRDFNAAEFVDALFAESTK